MNKICNSCKQTKNQDQFYADKRTENGLRAQCKDCLLIKTKEYRQKNLTTYHKYQREYFQKNKSWKAKINTLNFAKKDNGLYAKYYGMYGRCNYASSPSFKNYGGRGISIEWKSYQEFKDDMYDSFIEHLNQHGKSQTTLDRINVNGNYSKQNCRWATRSQQQKNRRKTH